MSRMTYDIRPTRLTESSKPTVKKAKAQIDQPVRIIPVKNLSDLDLIAQDYSSKLVAGNLAILFDLGGMPSKVFSWVDAELKWQEIGTVSSSGDVLTEATTEDKGVVTFADELEQAALKAVQANDPRLEPEWIASTKAPENTSVLWIDTNSGEPLIKWFNTNEWVSISNKEIIDDVLKSRALTWSSFKIEKELLSKANEGHKHPVLEKHLELKNPHDVIPEEIKGFDQAVSKNKLLIETSKLKHSHLNTTVLESLTDSAGELAYKNKPIGKGDMKISIYDTNNDGIIDKTESITDGKTSFDIIRLLKIEEKTHTHRNKTLIDDLEENFTTELKSKLVNISDYANNYVHPDNHSALMIMETPEKQFVKEQQIINWDDKYSKEAINKLLQGKESLANKGLAGGYAGLDPSGKISVDQLPLSFKDCRVVSNIAERDLTAKYSGLRVFVEDASADPAVESGSAEYAWNGKVWKLLSGFGMSNESLKFLVDEANNRLIIKVKYSDGSFKNAEIELT